MKCELYKSEVEWKAEHIESPCEGRRHAITNFRRAVRKSERTENNIKPAFGFLVL